MKPNFVVLILDCTRADHLSCYGYERETSPFLDSLAARGTRFANMVSAAPWTLPSHGALFTGTYSAAHGATDEHRYLRTDLLTLPEVLKGAGYATGAFCCNPWVSPETGFDRGIDHFYTGRPSHAAARPVMIAKKAIDVLLRRRDSGSFHTNRAFGSWVARTPADQPFFAFVHYNETHLHFHPPKKYREMFAEAGDTAARISRLNQDCNAYIAGAVDMTDDDFRLLTALYDAELRYADWRVERMAEELDRTGRLEDTVFVITADHGENLGDHGMMSHKFCVYETLLRVPLVMAGPGVPQGAVCEAQVQNVDIMPTLAALAGTTIPATGQVEGRSLITDGVLGDGHDYVFAERYRPNLGSFRQRFPDFDTTLVDVRKRSVSDGRWKFIWHSDGRHELYDLGGDPGEGRNVLAEHGDEAQRLERILYDWLARVEHKGGGDGEDAEFDEATRRQLEGLGYID
ncbi:MAG: sulfatase [Deltaproteobacteria bacterium]